MGWPFFGEMGNACSHGWTLFILALFVFRPFRIFKSRRGCVKDAGGLRDDSWGTDSSFRNELQRSFKENDFLLRWCVPHLLPEGLIEGSLVIQLSQLRTPLPLGLGGLGSRPQLSGLDGVPAKSGSDWVRREEWGVSEGVSPGEACPEEIRSRCSV